MSQGERRLAAIMFTDMVGYTALGQRNESLSLALVDEQRKLVRPILARHGGREVKTIGDAFLVEFPSAVEAVRCAYDIQRAAREFGLSVPPEARIHLRVGVHLGEVVESQGDISGDAVNVASRIEPLAEDGGVCVTRHVYEQVRGKVDLALASMGPRTLKNVSEPMEVFRMSMPWAADDTGAGPILLNPRRIAVLPFVSLSPDPNDEYFADGLTEELITRVSFVKGLEVIARTSAMNYKKKEKNASVIGKELKVGTLLEGSVRKAGNRIRVTAQLINASNEAHLWAENYDRNLDDVFEVQSSVAENVANALKLNLLDAGHAQDDQKVDPEAYTAYLKAMQFISAATGQDIIRARALLEDAIAKDPAFAKAYAALARVFWRTSMTAQDYAGTIARAEAAARKALELAPMSAEAHVAMADVHTALDQFPLAQKELEEATRINPNFASAYHLLGMTHLSFGRLDKAIEAYRKAASLDPLSISELDSLADGLRISGKVDEAMAAYQAMMAAHPDSSVAFVGASLCMLQRGEPKRAIEFAEKAAELEPGAWVTKVIKGVAFAREGRRSDAEAALDDLGKESEAVRRNAAIMIRTALGDTGAAAEELGEMAKKHSWYASILSDPLLSGLRKEPKFVEFCRAVGLPPPP